MTVLLHDVEVAGRRVDVVIRDGVVADVRPTERSITRGADDVVDSAGGALLPGLADHHLHLLALGAAMTSVDVNPRRTPDRDALVAALSDAHPDATGAVRAVGYSESTAGPLDRHDLDRIRSDVPVRVQHRSGALWMLNSPALDRLGAQTLTHHGVERDAAGVPTGRLWRADELLRRAGEPTAPDLAAAGRRLASLGITAVTDATPDLDATAVRLLADAHSSGDLPPDLLLLGAADEATRATGLRTGPHKIVVGDHELPALDTLVDDVTAAHESGRPVAVHVVTREALLLTLTALEATGRLPGDRLEHAAVVPPEIVPRLHGLTVVTQPAFIADRGDDYLRDVDSRDLPDLYRVGSLLAHDVDLACSSDAPYGPLDPWTVVAAAAERRTETGQLLGADERIPAGTALASMLTSLEAPGRSRRTVAPGQPADLVLLRHPLVEALRQPSHELVRRTWWHGRQVYCAD